MIKCAWIELDIQCSYFDYKFMLFQVHYVLVSPNISKVSFQLLCGGDHLIYHKHQLFENYCDFKESDFIYGFKVCGTLYKHQKTKVGECGNIKYKSSHVLFWLSNLWFYTLSSQICCSLIVCR